MQDHTLAVDAGEGAQPSLPAWEEPQLKQARVERLTLNTAGTTGDGGGASTAPG